jgi:hypothetical protein
VILVKANISHVVADLGAIFRELPSILPLLFQEDRAYLFLKAFGEEKFKLTGENVRAKLSNIESLIVVEGKLLADAWRR